MRLIKNIIIKAVLCLLVCCISENISAQINLSEKNKTIREIIHKIDKESDYNFFFNNAMSGLDKKVSIKLSNSSIENVLNRLLSGTGITYTVKEDNQVVLTDLKTADNLAQTASQTKRTITGTVTDEQGEPVIGANVVEKGTINGVITDMDGKFSLSVYPSSILQVSYIGYIMQEVGISGQTSLQLILKEDSQSLNEVVVVGYGTQRKGELTSSIASVKKESFTQGSVQDAAQLIQGKVAGLGVVLTNGNPTSTSQLVLRGAGSLLSGTSPLVIIDGVPGDLSTVAPEDIESVDVLKDGSAAAIYGTRGNNGVIFITTRKIHGEAKATIEVQSYLTVQTINRKLDMMDASQYRELVAQKKPGAIDHGYEIDWLDEILRTPITSVTNASFQGGTSATNYIANINYKSAEGIVKRSNNKVLTTRLEANHSMWDNLLKFNFNIMGRQQTYQSLGDGNSFNGSIYRTALIGNPTDRLKDEEGTWVEHTTMNGYMNPVAAIYESDGENKNTQIKTFGSITLTPINQFFVKALVSNTTFNETRGYSETKKHISTVRDSKNGFASRGTTRSSEKLMEITSQYREQFNAHNITALVGYSYQMNQYENYWMQNWDFSSDQYSYNKMQQGAALKRGEAKEESIKTEHKLIGFFGRVNYNYDNRYLLSASLRREGSSKFGENHKWGNFPAFSVGWNLSNESFMKDIESINLLKLRVGFGITGTVPTDPYMSLRKLDTGANFYTESGWIPTLKPASNANPNLKWEKKEEWNLGIDYSLFNHFIRGSFDFYKRTTKDMLWKYTVPMPPFLYNEMIANAGTMENKGLEAQINITPVQTRDFTWNSTLNFSTNKNKLVSLSNDQFQVHSGYIEEGWTGEPIQRKTHRIFEGGEMGNFWGFKTIGVDEDGRWIIEGKNGEPKSILDQTDDDRKKIGNGLPKHFLSWNNQISYKNFDLNISMRGVFGYDILNMPRMFYEVPVNLTRGNLLADAYQPKFGQVLNDQQELQYVSYFIEKGDFWKIDNITLGYNLQFNSKYIKKARFYATGTNLFTFTSYSGIDPEVNVNGLDPGCDTLGRYPSTRSFTIGTILTF
ncbi:TonB-linked SusC/RagA family outer membrane protein [Parabacteroides sp. PF5-5]|uniref:SusC/RagA family TonB-linked outer membrane protein n=1 Tax=unclassified Parabacteroides TaxID=2649774 RepID=UPI00247496E1|nr:MULTISPECIES: SusC/RagA family TonB-linked outer membrane protein [unclassified Parabacteroides]MDH6305177.1 TonB-linked SusC/RagA family outer membrane protein [Parabacteroides sp. PH5-39]MDH6316527.1 TonB-linked SusC/RagA family outer membrane protein [Parabacteroides sp. PF5-13]MDH6320037.1 TonB-linked SusC/RagA family outer membrane protein [Parabacteroides sp. PH5-13]MDH6323730.1 TonB-linked SusC/RagA family outer membrane protein [Parabacteroides sp. PH5-8]MDH6327714.1 TonB-linked Sus